MSFYTIIRCLIPLSLRRGMGGEATPLRIEGVRTELTPTPDDAELAATALLESLGRKGRVQKTPNTPKTRNTPKTQNKDSAYYRRLADRIREGHATEARLATRFVAYCEQELRNPLPPPGRLAALERELYQRLDIVEREGGELKRRWQHCLADITVRLMDGRSE